jgi:hypothetical protein
MGLRIRARRWAAEQARKRDEERRAAEPAAQAAAEAYHAEFLDRQRAADFLGISVHQFKRLEARGKGPSCVKNGETRQATVRWWISELQAYRDDPAAYIARSAAE